MYAGNSFYGHSKILLQYAGLPTFLPLPAAVQHGWFRAPLAFEAECGAPEVWVWSQRIAREYRDQYPGIRTRVVGAPFCYLWSIRRNRRANTTPSGSIIIPMHSTDLIRCQYSIEDYAASLSAMSREFQPMTVMLYHSDMTSPILSIYAKHGINTVTNGPPLHAKFLTHFLRNIEGKRFCIFNGSGSGPLYAAYAGRNS